MSDNQGYYSLVQYSALPERGEYVNIGVILFASRQPYVSIRFSGNAKRAERAFGVSLGAHFRNVKDSIEARLFSDFGHGWDRDKIERFVVSRTGKVRLTEVKSVLVRDPDVVLGGLFGWFVAPPPKIQRGPKGSAAR